MSLHLPRSFDKFVLGLPATEIVLQWGGHVAKVGGKVFALCADEGTQVVFKVSEMSFEGLTTLDGIAQAPYFAKRQWVAVNRGAKLSDAELRAYVAASHGMIAAKLTRKLRSELGLP
jgi:predicted DNA-binding protein (MmcQ/YjbR family)